MTDYQDALVLENLDLVNWVIRTRISIPNRPLLTYDDFYAIGCEAICRAALKYQPDMGAFAPFACRYIYNAIVDHCRAMNYRLERSVEISEDENASLLDIYGDIFLYGNWSKERDDPFKSRARVYVLKTLKQDKESYLAVGMLVNLICYYANEFVATHLDRFD